MSRLRRWDRRYPYVPDLIQKEFQKGTKKAKTRGRIRKSKQEINPSFTAARFSAAMVRILHVESHNSVTRQPQAICLSFVTSRREAENHPSINQQETYQFNQERGKVTCGKVTGRSLPVFCL